jgi:organic hydroperoxide reductase OsmC/OhrA
MSTYHARIDWRRGADEFKGQHYSRGHTWAFDEGLTVPASASPHVVRAPWAVTKAVDPEEAFVASVSSCHMLFFLSYVSRDGYIAESYEDAASGVLEKGPSGKVVMTSVTLRPVVTFSGKAPTQAEFDAWHHQAHEECYIANSVTSKVGVEASFRVR